MATRPKLFHPLITLLLSLLGAFLYAAWVTWRFPGGNLLHHYLYVVPIVVPFVAFLLDRLERFRRERLVTLGIDALVVGTSVLRMMGVVPLISGHTLFLIYAIVRPGSWVTRTTAALVMLETIYLKFFVWHDLVTPLTGIVLGVGAALITRSLQNSQPEKE